MIKLVQFSVEIVKMTDMYARLTSACHKKFIAPKHREGDLQKGEAVCIDCRVAKYSRTGLLGVGGYFEVKMMSKCCVIIYLDLTFLHKSTLQTDRECCKLVVF